VIASLTRQRTKQEEEEEEVKATSPEMREGRKRRYKKPSFNKLLQMVHSNFRSLLLTNV